jgi:hypothetical protein
VRGGPFRPLRPPKPSEPAPHAFFCTHNKQGENVKRFLSGLVIMLALAIVSSDEANAQCTVQITICSGNSHLAHSTGGSYGVGTGVHAACKICLKDEQETIPADCHECESLGTAADRAAYRAVIAAARRGDIIGVLGLAASAPTRVVFNSARNAVQIANCSGAAIVASLPISNAGQRFAAENLAPRAESSLPSWQSLPAVIDRY